MCVLGVEEERYLATAPATCGAAIEVPLIVLLQLEEHFLLLIQAEVILTPGAIMSTQLPKLLNEAKSSEELLAATVIALGTLAGE